MITLFLLNMFSSLVSGAMATLPSHDPLGINAAAGNLVSDGVFSHFGWVNAYLPLSEVVTGATILLGLFVVMQLVSITLWVLRVLHITGAN